MESVLTNIDKGPDVGLSISISVPKLKLFQRKKVTLQNARKCCRGSPYIKRTILGAIPPSKRSTLQRRQIRKEMGPAPKAGKKDTKNDEHRRQKPQIETHGDGATGPRGRGCDAEGRAEGGGGRGSQEPRRGFPK